MVPEKTHIVEILESIKIIYRLLSNTPKGCKAGNYTEIYNSEEIREI